jgi:hypothetical protein
LEWEKTRANLDDSDDLAVAGFASSPAILAFCASTSALRARDSSFHDCREKGKK